MIKRSDVTVIFVGIGLSCMLLCGCASIAYHQAFTNALVGEMSSGDLIGN